MISEFLIFLILGGVIGFLLGFKAGQVSAVNKINRINQDQVNNQVNNQR